MKVLEVKEPEVVHFNWKAEGMDLETDVKLMLHVSDTDTELAVEESGWPDNESGQQSRLLHMAGWVDMFLKLKARIEHDIDLRS